LPAPPGGGTIPAELLKKQPAAAFYTKKRHKTMIGLATETSAPHICRNNTPAKPWRAIRLGAGLFIKKHRDLFKIAVSRKTSIQIFPDYVKPLYAFLFKFIPKPSEF
jgi:hypothetical protein